MIAPEKTAQWVLDLNRTRQDLARANAVVTAARNYVCASPDPLDVQGQYERLCASVAAFDCTDGQVPDSEPAEPLASTYPGEVLVEDSWFPVAELPKILGNFMRLSTRYASEATAYYIRAKTAEAQVAAALARLESVARDTSLCRDLRAALTPIALTDSPDDAEPSQGQGEYPHIPTLTKENV